MRAFLAITLPPEVQGALSDLQQTLAASHAKVKVGMTDKDVWSILGPPYDISQDDSGAIWGYRVRSGSGVGYWSGVILLTPVIILWFFLLVLAENGNLITGGFSSPYGTGGHFGVHLNSEGVVVRITCVRLNRGW